LRIGLNLLHALPDIGGGWNYMSNLLAAVGREDRSNEYVAFVTETSETLVPRQPNFRLERIAIRSSIRATRVAYENTALQTRAWRERLDCMHWFANALGVINAAPAVVTVYDIQPFVPHGRLSTAKRTFLRWQLRSAVRRAAMLLPMSQSTADALQSRLRADPARMTVIPPMLERVFDVASPDVVERCRQRFGLPEHFWLYVAHMYQHKNHERLLLAYRDMTRDRPQAWPLVLRGDLQQASRVPELIRELGIERQVMILPTMAREDLPALYSAASALVFPSLYEGAGIPVLEAQACGCPIVASNIPAIGEFAGDAAVFFDPMNVTDIHRAMIEVADDAAARERMRRLGLARARDFRAMPVVRDLLRAYEQARGAGAATSRVRERDSHG
jgi:alpha-1,3-rhamnosyl/mannosyltransferase